MAKILVCDDDKEIVEAIEIYLTQDDIRFWKLTMESRQWRS